MERVIIAAAIVVVAAAVALVQRRRRTVDAPTQPHHEAPTQLDRSEFPHPEHEWLLVTFTSATCFTCADVARKAEAAASRHVGVAEIEYGARRTLHERYSITAVPTLVLADREGVVRAAFLGPVSATDLWAAVAEAREPGSRPSSCDHHGHPPDAAD
jgi:thioredoxin-related protein